MKPTPFRNRRGEAAYLDTAVFILVSALCAAFLLSLFSVLAVKQQMDLCADRLTRQIQLTGEVSADTDALFAALTGGFGQAENARYTVDASFLRDRKIQLGTPFRVTVTADMSLGGSGGLARFPLHLVSSAAGVSEAYWK